MVFHNVNVYFKINSYFLTQLSLNILSLIKLLQLDNIHKIGDKQL